MAVQKTHNRHDFKNRVYSAVSDNFSFLRQNGWMAEVEGGGRNKREY